MRGVVGWRWLAGAPWGRDRATRSCDMETNGHKPVVEYKPGSAFSGVVGRTTEESSPAWPQVLRAQRGAANVLTIVLDDTGFGQLGCYGGPIATPNIDAL